MAKRWYASPMTTTIDKAGRVVIPAEVRKRLGLAAGAELEMVIEGFSIGSFGRWPALNSSGVANAWSPDLRPRKESAPKSM